MATRKRTHPTTATPRQTPSAAAPEPPAADPAPPVPNPPAATSAASLPDPAPTAVASEPESPAPIASDSPAPASPAVGAVPTAVAEVALSEAAVPAAEAAATGPQPLDPEGPLPLNPGQQEVVRQILLNLYPAALPEFLGGETLDDLLASLPIALAARQVLEQEQAQRLAATVPRGGSTREQSPAFFAALSPEGKIAQGLQHPQ